MLKYCGDLGSALGIMDAAALVDRRFAVAD
jgi:hypothetical protein